MDISVEHRIEGFTAAELFTIAAEIEAYPDFLPFCIAARVLQRDGDKLKVDNLFGVGPLRVRFNTQALFNEPHGIVITSDEPPFRELTISWSFSDQQDGGCLIGFEMKQVFRSAIMEGLAAPMASTLEKRLIKNFEARARKVYGRP